MAYRTMPEPVAPAPPKKWPKRVVMALAIFVSLACGFMELIDFGAHVDGPGVGYGSGVLGALTVGFFGGAALAIVMLAAWPTARLHGVLGGIALAVAFIFAKMPIHLLRAAWHSRCDHGEGAACHGLGDERRGCQVGYWPSCSRLLERTPEDQTIACAAMVLPCSRNEFPTHVCDQASQTCRH